MNVAIKLHLLIFCGHLDDALFEILTYKDPAIGLYKAVLFGMAERQVVFDGCLGSRRWITGGRKELWMSKRLHHPPRGFYGATGWSCKLFAKKVPGKPQFGSGSFSLWGIGAQPFSQITGSLCARPSQKGARAESKICKKHETEKKWLAGFRYPKSSVHQSRSSPRNIAEMICILEPCGVQFVSCLQPPRCPTRRERGEEQGFGVEGCENLTQTGVGG